MGQHTRIRGASTQPPRRSLRRLRSPSGFFFEQHPRRRRHISTRFAPRAVHRTPSASASVISGSRAAQRSCSFSRRCPSMMRAHSASHSQSTRSASGSGGRSARARARPLEYGRVGLHGTTRQRLGHFSIPLTHAQCSLQSSLFFRDLWSSHCIFQVSSRCAVPWVFATAPSGPISCRVTSLLQSFEFAPLPSWFWCGFLQWTWRHLCCCKGERALYNERNRRGHLQNQARGM